MPQPLFITGEAGSGKTRKLMEEAAVFGGELVIMPHQRALAIAVMHGARRRLQSTLAAHCQQLPVTVSTIHSFALTLINRWRRSVGLSLPMTVCQESCGLAEKHYRTQATFEEIMDLACRMLESPTVTRTLAATFPLVIVDEFQDCTAGTLGFVQALAKTSQVLLAADHFQKLHDVSSGCPAAEWAAKLKDEGRIRYEDLTGCHRTHNACILRAARALRDNVKASGITVPVYHAPNVGPAAVRIVGRFAPWGTDKITTGSCAIIVLSLDDPLLAKLLTSFDTQLAKRNPKRKIAWSSAISESVQQKRLFADLEIDGSEDTWKFQKVTSNRLGNIVSRDIRRFAMLRGITDIPQGLARQFAQLAVHNSRAFSRSSSRFQVLTVHGAKNREFDHVFVFWTFKAEKWTPEEQRRLLYNAITRAKCDCTVLALGTEQRIKQDPVLSLLGPSAPAIDPAWGKAKGKGTATKN
jgi:AAA domain/UvrD-like helicase C-terminal domain